jgi:hypothetical protein
VCRKLEKWTKLFSNAAGQRNLCLCGEDWWIGVCLLSTSSHHATTRLYMQRMVADLGDPAEQALQERNGSITSAKLQRLSQEVCLQTLDDWKDSATECVHAKLFDKIEFVTPDEELVVGGCSINKLVCTCCCINICGAVERTRVFWEDKGGEEKLRTPFTETGKLLRIPLRLHLEVSSYIESLH